MRGFVYSMPAIKEGRPTQWSHMLGVAPEMRAAGFGARLKLAQREAALAMGLDLIEWTYDPLQAANAHLNFAKLGVVVEEYEENIYGESSSPLHSGTPTDRFVAEWHLGEPHVERRIAPRGQSHRSRHIGRANAGRQPVESSRALAAPRQNGFVPRGSPPPGGNPHGFFRDARRDPALAQDWRLSTRRIFQHYFARGYRAVDFFLAREAGRGQYLLAQRPSWTDVEPCSERLSYPGGQLSERPPSTCRWMWKTVWPASALC